MKSDTLAKIRMHRAQKRQNEEQIAREVLFKQAREDLDGFFKEYAKIKARDPDEKQDNLEIPHDVEFSWKLAYYKLNELESLMGTSINSKFKELLGEIYK